MSEHPPTSRIARTRRFGGLVAGQGLRWAGTRAANALRSDEAADAATGERAAATARELVKQLGQMKGAAMKIGQVLSTSSSPRSPSPSARRSRRRSPPCATTRHRVPFKAIEKLLQEELGQPVAEVFSEFEPEAIAAASIGQVHRATTKDGRRGRGQGPVPRHRRGGRDRPAQHADAVAADQAARARARRQRAGGRAARADRRGARLRGRGPATTARWRAAGATTRSSSSPRRHRALEPAACSSPSSSSGRRFDVGQGRCRRPTATASARSSSASSSAPLTRLRRAAGDPHPGNYLYLEDGRVGFLDFGLMRRGRRRLPRGGAPRSRRRSRAGTPRP